MEQRPLLADVEAITGADYQAKLEADRLTAEFRSPLNSQNRRRKLRAPTEGASLWQDPEQLSLIGGE